MRKKKDTHSFDFRPLGLAIREAREKAGLSRNDLGDKVFYGERHIADIENIGKHPSFQLFHDLVTMFHISVDEYFYPQEKAEKAMQLLHEAYTGAPLIIKNIEVPEDFAEQLKNMRSGIITVLDREDNVRIEPMNIVFRFPAEDEIITDRKK